MTDDNTITPPTDNACPGAAVRWTMRCLALVALGISGFLLTVSLRGGAVPGCSADSAFDCTSVLASRWAYLFNVPVSAPAVVAYALVLGALANIGPRRTARQQRIAWCVLFTLVVAAAGAAIWFTSLLLFIEDDICIYCLAAHGCGVALGGLVFWSAISQRAQRLADRSGPTAAVCVVVGLAGVAALVAGQLLYSSPRSSTPIQLGGLANIDTGPGPQRQISILGDSVRLRPHDFPIVGSADAKHIMVYLFDYTCPHCRGHHDNLQLALERYGDQLALITLPMPLDADCNATVLRTKPRYKGACAMAKIALALWRTRPEAYAQFDQWMFAVEKARPLDEVRAYAVELLGTDVLDAALAEPWIQEQINKDVSLYGIVSEFADHRAVPQLVFGSTIISGQPSEPKELFELLEQELDIVPLSATTEP